MIKKIMEGLTMITASRISNTLSLYDLRNENELSFLEEWLYHYQGKPSYLSFDNCKRNSITDTLNLGSFIPTTLKDLTLLEFESSVRDNDQINEIYQNFIDNSLSKAIELTYALGSVVLKPYFNINNKMEIEIIKPTDFIPIRFENGQLYDCIFISSYSEKVFNSKKYYTLLEKHTFKNNTVTIQNIAYLSAAEGTLGTPINLSSTKWQNRTEVAETKSDKPLFVHLKTHINNNIDIESETGISIFHRALPNIKNADKSYSQLNYEFDSGERIRFANESVIRFNKVDSRLYYKTIESEDNSIQDITSTLRNEEYQSKLNKELINVENNCYIAKGTLSDMMFQAKTATEILSTKEKTYNTIVNFQKRSLTPALKNLVSILQFWESKILGIKIKDVEVSIMYYDSVLAESSINEDIAVMQSGLMPKYIVLMRRYNLTEEEARKWIEEARFNFESEVM